MEAPGAQRAFNNLHAAGGQPPASEEKIELIEDLLCLVRVRQSRRMISVESIFPHSMIFKLSN
jgi:hypothetical protein